MHHTLSLLLQWALVCLLLGGVALPLIVNLIGAFMDRNGWGLK